MRRRAPAGVDGSAAAVCARGVARDPTPWTAPSVTGASNPETGGRRAAASPTSKVPFLPVPAMASDEGFEPADEPPSRDPSARAEVHTDGGNNTLLTSKPPRKTI